MKYFLRFFILAAAAGLLAIGGCRQKPTPETALHGPVIYPDRLAGEPSIRVRVVADSRPLDLSVSGPYKMQVITVTGESVSGAGTAAVTITAAVAPAGLKMGKDIYRQVTIIPEKGTVLKIRQNRNGRLWERVLPGDLTFAKDTRGNLQVVATLPFEQYLPGVVAGEMGLNFPPEALKAQAVAARTYALYRIKTRAANAYDVESTTSSQVWKPEAAHDRRARLAVAATRGQILTENNRLFPAYFCADCGGLTSDGRHVFPGAGGNALGGGVRCDYPTHHTWTRNYTRSELTAALTRDGLSSGRLLRLELLDEHRKLLGSRLARAYYVRLVNDNGVERVVGANSFRLAVGAGKDELASVLMLATPLPDNQTISFSGRGFGHGVGLCQYGAKYEAERRKSYRAIVEKYYPGAELVKVW